MKFLSILAFLTAPAALVAADYDITQLAMQLGQTIAHLNQDRIYLDNMINNFTPAVDGKTNLEQAKKFWDDFMAANRLATNAVVMLEMFYFNYNNTKSILSYGNNCQLD